MLHVLQLVAATTPPPDDAVGPGVGGFLVIFVLALATVLLIRSMVGHLRKVRYGPGPDAQTPGTETPGTQTSGTETPETETPETETPDTGERSDERSG